MFTYDVVTESIRNPTGLATELTKRSSEGWEVVNITSDGHAWLHAFIRRQGTHAVATTSGSTQVTNSASVTNAAGTASAPANATANWYKDPSGRFELRYWNGSAWTEHVATAGKQSIDQPQK